MITPLSSKQTVEQAAADWFGLKRSGRMSADQTQAFEAWLSYDPEHRAAYDNLEHYWQAAGSVREDPEILVLRESARRTYRRRWLAAGGAALAAGIAAAVVFVQPPTGVQTPSLRSPMTAALGAHAFRTEVGQSTTVVLADGSTVTLDTDSRMRTRFDGGRRFVELQRGRAFFKVAKDGSRPFVVLAAGRTVTALGTAFEVEANPKRFEVTLVEGRVRVEAPRPLLPIRQPEATEMTAGSQLVSRDERAWSVAPTDVSRETSWLRGRLAFDNDSLGEVVAEMNRYSDRKIVIRDPALAGTPILGVFKAGDIDGLVRALEGYGLAQVSKQTDEQIELSSL